MTTATLRRSGSGQIGTVAVLLAAAAGAWVLSADRMAGMDEGPGGELGTLGWFAVTWLLMMAAMMLPAMAPVAVAYGRRAASAAGNVAFAGGYLAAWVAAGLAAYAAIEAVQSADLEFLAWDEAGRYVAAGTVLGAGLYQLTPHKTAFLRRCRAPGAFVEEQWRRGVTGALGMGARYGGVCIGCCWAMMAALFALGVMSLTWMAVVAALIVAERVLPWDVRIGVAVVLLALGAGVALAPDDVPGLTIPGSGMEMHPGSGMEMQ
jgi:predicted metal-binding membrane protein